MAICICPHCGKAVNAELSVIGLGRQRGYAKAREKMEENIRLHCTPEKHAEKAKTMGYCNFCKHKIA